MDVINSIRKRFIAIDFETTGLSAYTDRIVEIGAVLFENGTNTDADRKAINAEVSQLKSEIDRVQQSTQFNTLNLLNGDFSAGKAIQVGAANVDAQRITIKIGKMDTASLGINNISLSTEAGAKSAISAITSAIAQVSEQRSNLGAVQNRLEHTIANLDNVVENTTAAESSIRDTDMAKTMV